MLVSRTTAPRPGFTLVEILIVVVILGILASIVIANLTGATEEARKAAFIANGTEFSEQAAYFALKTGSYLPDSGSGDLPAGFEYYIDAADWENGTPIAGVWDHESFDTGGYASAVGVHFQDAGEAKDDAYMTQVDAMGDDGDLATGAFRKIAGDRYYFIVAD